MRTVESIAKFLISAAAVLLVAQPTSAQFRIIDLGTLGGPISHQGTIPQGINNRGEVVGESNGRAFLWTAETGMIDLGILGQIGPTSFSDARAINKLGQVVGRSSIAPLGALLTRSSGRPTLE